MSIERRCVLKVQTFASEYVLVPVKVECDQSFGYVVRGTHEELKKINKDQRKN